MPLTLIKNGTLITAADIFVADILVEGEKIAQIGHEMDVPESAKVIDCTGKLIMPGGVDVHTHLNLPMFGTVSADDHYSGHKAAAFGGTTTTIDFVSQDFPSLRACVDAWHQRADSLAAIDFSFHMNISTLNDQVEKEMPRLVDEGITSIKVFMAYNGRLRLQDGEIFRAMRIAKEQGILTLLHAENGDVIDILVTEAIANGHKTPEWHAYTRPAWGAVEAFLRGCSLSAQTGAPLYIVHMNSAGEKDQLQYARQQGVPVMGETCMGYLFFTEEELKRPDGAKWVCSPPLRRIEDQQALWDGLREGIIQTIATDHCPFFYDGSKPVRYEEKEVMIAGKELGKEDFTKIPNGLAALGDRLPILWSYGVGKGYLTPNQFVALTSTQPAKIFGLYPQKGTLMPGSDADIVVWDPQKKLTYGVKYAHHRIDHNLFEGWDLCGFPEKVFSRGNLIVDGEHWYGRPGLGRYIQRKAFAPVL